MLNLSVINNKSYSLPYVELSQALNLSHMTQVYFHFLYYFFDLWILVSKIKSQINTVEKIYFLYVYF